MTFSSSNLILGVIDYSVLAACCLWIIGRGLRFDVMPTVGRMVDRAVHPVRFWLAMMLQLAIFAEALFLLLTRIS